MIDMCVCIIKVANIGLDSEWPYWVFLIRRYHFEMSEDVRCQKHPRHFHHKHGSNHHQQTVQRWWKDHFLPE